MMTRTTTLILCCRPSTAMMVAFTFTYHIMMPPSYNTLPDFKAINSDSLVDLSNFSYSFFKLWLVPRTSLANCAHKKQEVSKYLEDLGNKNVTQESTRNLAGSTTPPAHTTGPQYNIILSKVLRGISGMQEAKYCKQIDDKRLLLLH